MNLLHLDPYFKPISGREIQFESFLFSGGEPHIKINPNFDVSEKITLTHRINTFQDLGLLCMAVDALQRMGGVLHTLLIPYFPGARQDRLMVKGEPLSVKVYADIINALKFKEVVVFDPHSHVTPAVLNNCKMVNNHKFIRKVGAFIKQDFLLISPDGGALKKVYSLSKSLGGIEVIECSKKRDVNTGKLSSFKVYTEDLHGKDCLIVDDICDGGFTFMGLARELKKKNSGRLYLAISHGIFSKGFDHLHDFEKIFVTDSIKNIKHPKLKQMKLDKELMCL